MTHPAFTSGESPNLSGNDASRPLRALVVDDDEWAIRLVSVLLEEACPGTQVVGRTEPDCSGEFDMYFLDNDFSGQKLAGQLARQVREQRPDALIVAFSATLDAPVLKELLNAGCSGACDKSRPSELDQLATIASRYATAALATRRSARSEGRGFLGAVRSIRDLLHEWNTRLEGPSDLHDLRGTGS